MLQELIQSVSTVIPAKGSNAGKTMYVINGKHWSKVEPTAADTHICLEEVTKPITTVDASGNSVTVAQKYTNVVGFSKDTRMSIQQKAAFVTSYDMGYSVALASLLR